MSRAACWVLPTICGSAHIRTTAKPLALSALLRKAFGPLVLRTAPPAEAIAAIAIEAGFAQRALEADPVQPVYVLELA